ncbi:MAG TPA: phosphatidylglycerol lysyltransferase domain-containing protein [Syntrophales bacterium]|mgnify:FL=1|nr:phosphatidylglycerol lysyltransferase domain-containing protein [Syntrophales bacterium]HOM07333.1 phosphatidylglycerol lysyltransferase domain-containing protein [Syntrophales bacterium]HPC01286.1 phosphatidylglycerol lysyltransferase domain-containing protein [Syntrophales bacterium]HPQ06822.1 phosphatidylglycerol lysyltransferase domain-containing protein [Syntrophales bacterium]HRS87053.1 phosphatidylglycerol lysyltransferase domain-containing protein [Syntrophales bacterium]
MMKELTVDDYPLLEPFFARQTYRLGIYSLPSLIAWSQPPRVYRWGIAEGLVLVTSDALDRPDEPCLVMPVGGTKAPSPAELRALLAGSPYGGYCFVPGDYVEEAGRGEIERHFRLGLQEGYEDYLYRKEDLATLRGNRYVRKRNLIHQFERNYVASGRVETAPLTAGDVPACLDFLEEWCRARGQRPKGPSLAAEVAAARRALRTVGVLPWRGLMIRVDGRVCAFALASRLTDLIGVLNFEKALPSVKGLYQYLDREAARLLFPAETFINKESDMGVPALAVMKRSYGPVETISSYRLTPR